MGVDNHGSVSHSERELLQEISAAERMAAMDAHEDAEDMKATSHQMNKKLLGLSYVNKGETPAAQSSISAAFGSSRPPRMHSPTI